MKTYFTRVLPCIAALACASCSEEEIQDYSGDAALYFYRGTYETMHVFQRDSLFYSFLSSGKERDTLYIDTRVMGHPVDRPRAVTIEQTDASDPLAAVPERHYVPFDDPAVKPLMQVPANAVACRLPVILLRDESLEREIVTLRLRIVENDEFKVGIEKQSTFQFKFSDQFLPSTNWQPGNALGWALVFGEYGKQKHWFVHTHVGFTDFDADVSTYPQDVRKFYNAQAREKLAAYNAANPVLKEDNGQEVTFPVI
ncbi:MAG: DUF4843 domain-containing protein [Odoribacteraceae bacterium]|jgi:hypothetical protein|nr:DUF4843 domain-containing protein [Odoribacteraceae bacterium]